MTQTHAVDDVTRVGDLPRSAWRVLALVAAFCTLPVLHQISAPFRTLDEAYLLVYPEQILLGRVPHQDFFTVYGPGGYALLAIAFWVTEPSIIVERIVGLLYHVAVATGVVTLTRPYGRNASEAAGTASALLLIPVGLGAYAWFGGLALAVWSLALLQHPRTRAVVVAAGLLGGLVMAWRLEMSVLVLAAVPLLRAQRLYRPYIAGLAIGLAPMAVYILYTGGAVLENVFLSRLALNAQLRPSSVSIAVWLTLILLVASVGWLLTRAVRRPTRQAFAMSHAVLAALLLPQALQRTDLEHVLYAMCIAAPLAIASLIHRHSQREIPSADRSPLLARRLAVLSLLSLAVLTASSAVALATSDVTAITHNGRTTLVADRNVERVAAQMRLITRNVPTGGRIFIGSTDMSVPTITHFELYHMLPEYRAESYFLELPPGVAELTGSPLVEDIEGADWLVLSHMQDSLRQALFPYFSKEGADHANVIVSKDFCEIGSVPGSARALSMTLFRRCSASSSV